MIEDHMTVTPRYSWRYLDETFEEASLHAIADAQTLTDPHVLASSHRNGDAKHVMYQCPDHHEAKKYFQEQRSAGTLKLILTPHAEKEFAKDDMDMQDCRNILRGGVWDPPEWENGSWRYRVRTPKMAIIIEIDFEVCEFTVVTGWRNT